MYHYFHHTLSEKDNPLTSCKRSAIKSMSVLGHLYLLSDTVNTFFFSHLQCLLHCLLSVLFELGYNSGSNVSYYSPRQEGMQLHIMKGLLPLHYSW